MLSSQVVASNASAHDTGSNPHPGMSCDDVSAVANVGYIATWPAWGLYSYYTVSYMDHDSKWHKGRWVCLPWEAIPDLSVNIGGGGNGPGG